MEPFIPDLEMAQKRLMVADHILTQTFPLLKDPKLLLAVLEHLFAAAQTTIDGVLKYERVLKRIPPYGDTSDHIFHVFAERCMQRYGIAPAHMQRIQELKTFRDAHHASGMEFRRKDRFVICVEGYKMKTLTYEKLNNSLQDVKAFVAQISEHCSHGRSTH